MTNKSKSIWLFPFLCLGLGLIPIIAACSSIRSVENKGSAENISGEVHRHVAWLEGDVQSDFEPYRKILSDKLEEMENSTPDPNNVDSYLDYLSVLDASGKSAEAESKIKKFMVERPQEKRAAFLLGVHYMRTKKKELAKHFFASLEKDPNFPWKSLLYNNLGMLSMQDKDRNVAISYFEKAIAAQPPIAAPRVNLGAIYLQSKSYGQAQPLFRNALAIDADFEDAALGLGITLEAQGKFEEAHQTYADFGQEHGSSLSVLYNDSLVLGNRLSKRDQASEMMLRYIQRGGKETAKAHEIIQGWR